MNKENLKPCPNILCNSTEFLELIQLKPLHYYIECGMCNCTTPLFYSSKEEAVEAWNTRPENPQSAWELFSKLYKKYGGKFGYYLEDKLKLTNTENAAFMVLWNLILNYSESDALKFLTEIEKELEG